MGTPKECQDQCRQNPRCSGFTHFSTQCYLLVECGRSEHCEGCVSGPEDAPDFETCPWPPVPTSGPTEPQNRQPPQKEPQQPQRHQHHHQMTATISITTTTATGTMVFLLSTTRS